MIALRWFGEHIVVGMSTVYSIGLLREDASSLTDYQTNWGCTTLCTPWGIRMFFWVNTAVNG